MQRAILAIVAHHNGVLEHIARHDLLAVDVFHGLCDLDVWGVELCAEGDGAGEVVVAGGVELERGGGGVVAQDVGDLHGLQVKAEVVKVGR